MLEIKRVLQQDAHDTAFIIQFDDTVELLKNALARSAELERTAQSDSSRIGAELSSVKLLLQKSEEYRRGLEGSVKEAQERLAAEKIKFQEKHEQLIREQDKARESNERLNTTIKKLNETNGRLEVIEKELEQARRGKTQQVGVLTELAGAVEESQELKAECGKLRREKDRLQVGLHPAKQPPPTYPPTGNR